LMWIKLFKLFKNLNIKIILDGLNPKRFQKKHY